MSPVPSNMPHAHDTSDVQTNTTQASTLPTSTFQRIPRLHILTSDAVIARPDFLTTATALMQAIGTRGAFHLRTRLLAGHAYAQLAQQLLAVSQASGALLVINDRVDVALAVGAEAVQLGSVSLSPTEVSQIAPNLRIGVSVHNTTEAQKAVPAAWLIVGHIYDTPSHPNRPGSGSGIISAVLQTTHTPVIAVGGIHPSHVASLLTLGAAGVAVISGIWDERTPKDAAMRYLS